MIDLNKFRTLEPLEEMRNDLKEFLSNPAVPEVYKEDPTLDVEDYESDKEKVINLLIKVERRIKSLGNFLNKKKSVVNPIIKKRGSPRCKKLEPTEVPLEQ